MITDDQLSKWFSKQTLVQHIGFEHNLAVLLQLETLHILLNNGSPESSDCVFLGLKSSSWGPKSEKDKCEVCIHMHA